MKIHKLRILSNKQVSKRYWRMTLDSSSIEEEITPGQFFNIKCTDEDYPFLRRPFSIYQINQQKQTIEFLYLVKGLGTKRMTELKSGDLLDIVGPLGRGFTLPEPHGQILLLARGVGVATLAALAQRAILHNINCVAIMSARSHNDLIATDTLIKMGVEVYKVTDEDGSSDVGHVRQIVQRIMKEREIKTAYTCGSKRLAKMLREESIAHGIPAQIAVEEHMGCGLGVCFACVCDLQIEGGTNTVRVCTEGPVFSLKEVVLS